MSFDPDIFYDFTLMNLGEFLKKEVNKRGIEAMSKYPERFPEGYPDIIRTLWYAGQPNISTIEYPALKVFRMSCDSYRYKDGNGVRICNIVIEYSLGYPVLEILPNLLNWVDYHIQQLLLDYEYAEFPQGKAIQQDLRYMPDRSEYRTGVSPTTQEEFPFLRLIVRLRDDACPTPTNHKDQFNFNNC